MPMSKEKKKVAYGYATGIGLAALSVFSVITTVLMAIRGNSRLPLMVSVSLVLLFLTAINHLRVKQAFRSLQKNLRLRRKAHATRGVILRFPESQQRKKPPEEPKDK